MKHIKRMCFINNKTKSFVINLLNISLGCVYIVYIMFTFILHYAQLLRVICGIINKETTCYF